MGKSEKKNASKKKGPSIEKVVAAVNDSARAQVEAESAARKAAAKASTKRAALVELRASAAAAAARAEKAAKELKIAQSAAKLAESEEKKAARKAEKAAEAKKAAEKTALKLAERTRAARRELDALPASARGLAEIGSAGAKGDGPKKPKSAKKSADDAQAEPADSETSGAPQPAGIESSVSDSTGSDDRTDETVASTVILIPADDAPTVVDVEVRASAASSAEPQTIVAVETPTGDWTLARLRLLARERQVRGYSAMSKARLLEVLLTPGA